LNSSGTGDAAVVVCKRMAEKRAVKWDLNEGIGVIFFEAIISASF